MFSSVACESFSDKEARDISQFKRIRSIFINLQLTAQLIYAMQLW